MRKLRESERSQQIRLTPTIKEKIHHDLQVVDLCKLECDDEALAAELDRLREVAIEQQEVIEVLRQAVKEKERKLEQLSNKRRKEEFYKQWLELEPVAEVDDEEEEESRPGEEGDSALSSGPSSLSPQPGSGNRGITREAYESVLLEIEELQQRLAEEQEELVHARTQVRELEKALLQETRGSHNSRRALSDKLRIAEEREAGLVAEISELREQNELLEFRVLELEESPHHRDTPDPADSGIVSPEPIHIYNKDHHTNKHRDRAVATVIPYTSTFTHPLLPSDPQKAPLSLQESGIFEEEEIDHHVDVELSSRSTQTEAPAGELLQEVQRLQELRARIQERASKVAPISPVGERKLEAPFEFALDVTPLRERIRELEDKLKAHDAERQISKQREEELLDENERLTEKLYCLESELKSIRDRTSRRSDAETNTDASMKEFISAETQTETDQVDNKVYSPKSNSCQRIYNAAVMHMDKTATTEQVDSPSPKSERDEPCQDCGELWKKCDERIHSLARTEFCLRQQIASLEQREAAFFETLRQADATWAKLEADYEAKQREMNERLNAQVELNRALFEHLTKLNNRSKSAGEPMEVDDYHCQRTTSSSLTRSVSMSGIIVRAEPCRVSTVSRTNILTSAASCDEIDMKSLPPLGSSTELATEAKEGMKMQSSITIEQSQQQQKQLQQSEPQVTINESSSDSNKQVIYFRWR